MIKGIYNAKGRLISGTSDDDSGAGSNAKVIFTPTTDGVYFVSASAYGSSTGTYALSVSTLVDTTAPTLSSVTPADNATNVSVGANIVVTFSEEIQRGSGNIVLTTSSGVTTISMSDVAQVQISGDQMVINPASDLAAGQAYDVQIASGAVRDLAGNAFGGTAFDFTTASASSGGGVTWNIMVYVAGDNDLEGFGVGDVNEMESVRLPDGVKMSVLFDRSPSYDASNGNWTGTRQGLITFDGTNSTLTSLPTAAAITEVNTGLASSLTSFINWADGAVNAEHNMLVIWNHGGGLDGVAWDYSSRYDYLTFNEIKSTIASTVSKFDVIGFDACLMAMSELVYDLSSLTDYVVASQELEPGDGWDYAEFIRRLQADASLDGQDVALAAVNAYPAQYAGASDITLSAVSTSAFSSVASELNDFVAAALALPSSNADWSVMRAAADAAREYPYRDTSYGFADLGEFMAIVANRAGSAALKAEAAQVAAAVDAAVIAEVGSVSAATGLSIYLPPAGISSLGGWYSETSFNFLAGVAWDDFLYRL